MDVKYSISSDAFEWCNEITLMKLKSTSESSSIINSYKISKKKILRSISKLKNGEITKEIVIILSEITRLLSILYFEEENELELVTTSSLMHTYRIYMPVENYDTITWLENLVK